MRLWTLGVERDVIVMRCHFSTRLKFISLATAHIIRVWISRKLILKTNFKSLEWDCFLHDMNYVCAQWWLKCDLRQTNRVRSEERGFAINQWNHESLHILFSDWQYISVFTKFSAKSGEPTVKCAWAPTGKYLYKFSTELIVHNVFLFNSYPPDFLDSSTSKFF